MNKEFSLAAVISAGSGMMIVEDFGDIHEVLDFMAGENLFTHQIPRVCDEARPALERQHPFLVEVLAEARAKVTAATVAELRAKWEAEYGKTLAISPMTEDEHERIDPLSEMAENVHPSKIIQIR